MRVYSSNDKIKKKITFDEISITKWLLLFHRNAIFRKIENQICC